jgi:hypothetical protein
MKIANMIILALTASSLFLGAGCSKSDATTDRNKAGVQVDIPKLLTECQDITKPEIQASLNQISSDVYIGKYDTTLAELEKLSNAPDLNDKQKKLVKEVIEQVKQLAAKAAAK